MGYGVIEERDSSAAAILRSPLALIDRAAGAAIIVIMAAMVMIVSSQVFMRYALNDSFDWADETSRLCFIWTIFLSIPLALKRGGHIVMEMLITRVDAATRDLLYRAMSVLSIVMMAVITWQALKLTYANWDATIPALGLSEGLYFLPVCLGGAHTVLRLVDILFTGEPRREGIIE
jgi:TRAP-type transport system small permease protein